MRVGIIGCGLIGQKRTRALPGWSLAVCCDRVRERAEALACSHPGVEATTDWESVVSRADIDVVVVATTHDMLAPVAARATACGKHVFIEKPGARRASELDAVAEAARSTGALVRVGFNHRYHRAFQRARAIFESGAIGEPMFVRARYGHGGRVGYEKEWRAVPELSGGGEAIDQGIHLIDLARWFLGDFTSVQGFAPTYFWDMPVEDNAFLLLRSASNRAAFLHASWTEWKNLFSFEIAGKHGKLEITGFGGSYGTERLAHYQMPPEMGPPETVIYEYPSADCSWELEMAVFREDIRLNRPPVPSIADAQAALRVVEQLYQDCRP
jgi:predicted dehydrogenase